MGSPRESYERIEKAAEEHPQQAQQSGESVGEASQPVSQPPPTTQTDLMAALLRSMQAIEARMNMQAPGQSAPPPTTANVPPPVPTPLVVPEVHSGGRDSSFVEFQKLNPPHFHGHPGEDPYDFLSEMKKLGKRLGCSDEQLLDYATYNLKGSANGWWTTLEDADTHGSRSIPWEEFEVMFLDRFVPESLKLEKTMEFNRLVQGNMSVEEYNLEFDRLSQYVRHLSMPEKLKISRYMEGLNPELAFVMSPQLHLIQTLAQAMNSARAAGAMKGKLDTVQAIKKRKAGSYQAGGSRAQTQGRFQQGSGSSTIATGKQSGSYGNQRSKKDKADGTCFHCHQGAT